MGGMLRINQNRLMQYNWRDRVVKYKAIDKLVAMKQPCL